MQVFNLELKKDDVLCREGDVETDLFLVTEGELLVCVRKASQVIAIAKIGKGEYIGELSFFDNRPRGADIVALTKAKLLKIPAVEIRQSFPQWLTTVGKAMTLKLRLYDEVIRSRGIKKSNVETIKPLSMDEQRYYFKLLSK
ncbi:MAG: cyclic nucleotide-binding domain-containing protein [Bacteriovoracaceae bacterium]|nr:cyclic nucleotide-binding domain-containing protein [Bacteriovoracaceae bacterium]